MTSRPERRASAWALGAARPLAFAGALAVAGAWTPAPAAAQEAASARPRRVIVQGTHERLAFPRDVQRVAVGDPGTLGTIEISTRELLLLGKQPGQTSLIVWFADGTSQDLLVQVRRDLSLLQDALRDVHPNLTAEVAPDRDAVVLRGVVPDMDTRWAALEAARGYLESTPTPAVRAAGPPAPDAAGETAPAAPAGPGFVTPQAEAARRAAVIDLIRVEALPSSYEERVASALQVVGGPGVVVRRVRRGPLPDDVVDLFLVEGVVADLATLARVLRLAGRLLPPDRLESLVQVDPARAGAPPVAPGAGTTLEDKVLAAIRGVPGQRVTVRRVLKGAVPDDAEDVLVLEGRVANQVGLVRLLTLAAKVVGDDAGTGAGGAGGASIRVLANEAGALTQRAGAGGQGAGGQGGAGGGQLGGGVGGGQLGGGGRGGGLWNQVQTNVGRAKVLEAAGGRIVSFVEVADLPQVRVEVRFFEVNRTKLERFAIDASLLMQDFLPGGMTPSQAAGALLQSPTPVGSVTPADVRGILSFLGGSLGGEAQYADDRLTLSTALNILATEGIAKQLSSPTLAVLSGELATFTAGGEIPIPTTTFVDAAGAATTVPLNTIDFREFGVQLAIRPLVGDDDVITLDLVPSVITPDAGLTDVIRQTTGQAQQTTAFQTRQLRTSARLEDGQALLLGGLMTREQVADTGYVPFLSKLPLVEWLFQNQRTADSDFELVVLVNPVIIRPPVHNAKLWAFPGADELLRAVDRRPGRASGKPEAPRRPRRSARGGGTDDASEHAPAAQEPPATPPPAPDPTGGEPPAGP